MLSAFRWVSCSFTRIPSRKIIQTRDVLVIIYEANVVFARSSLMEDFCRNRMPSPDGMATLLENGKATRSSSRQQALSITSGSTFEAVR